jgi:hypothetical protein
MTKESEVSEGMREPKESWESQQVFMEYWKRKYGEQTKGYSAARAAWHARDAVIAQLHEDARRVANAVNLELDDLRTKWNAAERKLAKRDSEIAKFKSERGIHNIPHQMAGESWGEFLQRAETWLSFETAVARRAAIEECAALADSFSGVAMLAQEIRKLASPENQFTCTACHKTFASTPEDAEIGHLCIAADRGMTQREAIEEIKRSPPLASPDKETP